MKSKQYYSQKYDTDLYIMDENKEYINKIKKHNKRKKITFTVLALILIIIMAASFCLFYFHSYKSYKVVDEIEHSDSTYVSYKTIEDLQLRYTRDGASLFKNTDQVIWSSTYEMQDPQVDISGNYIIIYEKNFNLVYLFNLEKLLYTYESTMPIKEACVSTKGTVAILVEEDDQTHRIQYLDSSGETIAEGRTFFSQRGYPLDMSLSNDGYKLCISYYVVDGATTKTNLVFHSFDEIGDAGVDNIVTDDYYTDTIIPTVTFMEDDSLIAFGDNCILLYDNGIKPKCTKNIELTEEIVSICYDDKNFAIVTKNEKSNILKVYNKKAKEISKTDIDFEYSEIVLDSGKVLLYNSSMWQVYLKNGFLKAEGTYDKEIKQMIPAGYNTYMIVGNNIIEKIRLSD